VSLTSGPSRLLHLGVQTVEFRHAPRWLLAPKNRLAGETIRALAWLGPQHATEAIRVLKQKRTQEELNEIAGARAQAPEWIAKQMSPLVANG